MKKRTKILLMVLSVILAVALAFGVTYAIYTWQTIDGEESVIDGTSTCFDIVYTKGQDIGSNEDMEIINIGSTYTDGLSTTVKIKIDDSCDITGVGTIYLNTESDTSDYLINNKLLNYEVVVDSVRVAADVIESKDSIPIYSGFEFTTEEKSITVYVWINGENIDNTMLEEVLGTVYKGNITATAESRG